MSRESTRATAVAGAREKEKEGGTEREVEMTRQNESVRRRQERKRGRETERGGGLTYLSLGAIRPLMALIAFMYPPRPCLL